MDVTDKHGALLAKGDVIDFVYAGDHHEAAIEAVEERSRIHFLTVTITVQVPSGTATLIEKAKSHPQKAKSEEKGK